MNRVILIKSNNGTVNAKSKNHDYTSASGASKLRVAQAGTIEFDSSGQRQSQWFEWTSSDWLDTIISKRRNFVVKTIMIEWSLIRSISFCTKSHNELEQKCFEHEIKPQAHYAFRNVSWNESRKEIWGRGLTMPRMTCCNFWRFHVSALWQVFISDFTNIPTSTTLGFYMSRAEGT